MPQRSNAKQRHSRKKSKSKNRQSSKAAACGSLLLQNKEAEQENPGRKLEETVISEAATVVQEHLEQGELRGAK